LYAVKSNSSAQAVANRASNVKISLSAWPSSGNG